MTLSLDTSTAVDLLRGQRFEVRERFENHRRRGSEMFISSIVLFELAYGVRRSARPDARMRELDALLSVVPVTAFEGGDAMTAGELRLQLELPGLPVGAPDLLIAAQALNRGWTIVTSNVRHFARTGASLIDWRVSDEIFDPKQLIGRLKGGGED